jgi:hypothetical protein
MIGWEEVQYMKLKLTIILGLMALIVSGTSLQADFIQCGVGVCSGSTFADIINGTELEDQIAASLGNDVAFGNDGPDNIAGQNGNDLLFGGNGSDIVDGGTENDNILAGPDDGLYRQDVFGRDDNDTFYVFASETSTCLNILGGTGQDTVNLIGFGPYSAQYPFGQTGNFNGPILVVDPIAGGNILIWVQDQDDGGNETIHGLPSPNVKVLSQVESGALNCPELHPIFPT